MPLEKQLIDMSPAERIKRLRELEEQKKKEIEEAELLLKQAINEEKDEEEQKKQMPTPYLKAENPDQLESIEAKVLWAAKRGVTFPEKKEEERSHATTHEALEESVQSAEARAGEGVNYGEPLNSAMNSQKGISYQKKEENYISGSQQKFYQHQGHPGEEHHPDSGYHTRKTLPGHEMETQDFYSNSRKKK
ncbi:hypothetical protein HYU11_01715 [Candidatus Woesearchaeota archaeon]|nr:hypothetical protein [Candidatus Woesearchaeota archaeon]